MTRLGFTTIYLVGLLFAEALRWPWRVRRIRTRQAWRRPGGSRRGPEHVVLLAVLVGIWALPLAYAFTGWLRRFDYSLPGWMEWIGVSVFVVGLAVRWKAHRSLGTQWSPTLETAEPHALVTRGIYAYVRHPIYASLVLWAAAQPILLQNTVAGWSGIVAVGLLWLIRVPREEMMMLERFGDDYRRYMVRTGRLVPGARHRTSRRLFRRRA